MPPLDLDLPRENIPDAATRAAVQRLLQLVEQLYRENLALRVENQRLRDEISRLKGEQGKPQFPARRSAAPPRTPPADLSSEPERREPKPWQKGAKRERIGIDRVAPLQVDPAVRPPDAEFKGDDSVVIQDLVLRTDNVLFLKEIYSSPAQRRTFRAPLPAGYRGQFGPGIRTLALVLAYGCQVSEKQIHTLFTDAGMAISTGQVSAFLIADPEPLHTEARDILMAGLKSSPWQPLDDTPTRVNGENHACFTLCNPLYTAYQTRPSKARLTVLAVLQGGGPPRYRLDPTAWAYREEVGVAQKLRQQLLVVAAARAPDAEWDEAAFLALLATAVPQLGPQQRQRVLEAGALAADRAPTAIPVGETLVGDDAPQFRKVTAPVALCWVHDGRHYPKLLPGLACHQERVARFRQRYWAFYRALRRYQEQPTPAEATRREAAFDLLFSERTGWELLDHRMALPAAKKSELLAVWQHPELPLHNNPAELGVRRRVRKRDVSFGPRTAAGAPAWDTFQTLSATAAKLGISFLHYLQDRLSGAHRLPALAEGIEERAPLLQLGQSWTAS